MRFPGFIGGAYSMPSLPISAQRCINWYPEAQEDPNAATPVALRTTPGYGGRIDLSSLNPQGSDFVRALYRTTRPISGSGSELGSRIVVVGDVVAEYMQNGQLRKLGAVSPLFSFVSMVDDGFGLVIADGVSLYRMDMDTLEFRNLAFTLSRPTGVAFLNGRTIVQGTSESGNKNVFFWSELYDNATWDPLSYASAEASADPITRIETCGGLLWLFGPSSYEVWSPGSDPDLPFSPTFSSSGSVGLHAPGSVTRVGDSLFFLGMLGQGSPQAFMTTGTSVKRISTLPLESEWGAASTVSDATGWGYTDTGHTFWVLNFDVLDRTYVWDVTTSLWHERAIRDPDRDTLHRWEPNHALQSNGVTLVGSRYEPALFILSHNYAKDDNNVILRLRTTAHLRSEARAMMVNRLSIDLENGNGITEDDPSLYASEPTCMLRYSWDSARTWSAELRTGLGALGQYRRQTEYRGLGTGTIFTAEIKISDPVRTSILAGWIEAEQAGGRA